MMFSLYKCLKRVGSAGSRYRILGHFGFRVFGAEVRGLGL